MTLYNTNILTSPGQVPKIFHDLRFSNMNDGDSADCAGGSADEKMASHIKLISEPEVKEVP